MVLTLVIISAFIIWFTSVWIAVISLLSFISGWSGLSRIYPAAVTDRTGLKLPMSSIKMGLVSYRNCVNLTFTEAGIRMEIMKLFSIKHKPLFIPYSRISGINRGKFIRNYTSFKIGDKSALFFGRAGEELFSRIGTGPAGGHL